MGGDSGVPLRKNPHIEQVVTGFWDVDSNTALGMTKFQDRLRYHFLQVVQMLLRVSDMGILPGPRFSVCSSGSQVRKGPFGRATILSW